MAEADQIAGIHGHAEMIHHATGAHDRGRAYVAAVHGGGGAGDQQQLGTLREQIGERGGERRLFMRNAQRWQQRAGEGANAAFGCLFGAAQHACPSGPAIR